MLSPLIGALQGIRTPDLLVRSCENFFLQRFIKIRKALYINTFRGQAFYIVLYFCVLFCKFGDQMVTKKFFVVQNKKIRSSCYT
jgi:hypothetical protein